ncbi:MAG: DUF5320 domain-containing protein [Thermotogota bacterium]|nr:DUF5320 domain-containing protein [Thermotogota bacterium]
MDIIKLDNNTIETSTIVKRKYTKEQIQEEKEMMLQEIEMAEEQINRANARIEELNNYSKKLTPTK